MARAFGLILALWWENWPAKLCVTACYGASGNLCSGRLQNKTIVFKNETINLDLKSVHDLVAQRFAVMILDEVAGSIKLLLSE